MKYADVRGELKTGDLLFFSGKSRVSELIKWFTGSKWSHVGMVCRIAEYDLVLCWESTTLSNARDVHFNRPLQGVQLVPLSARIEAYDGAVGLRQLSSCLSDLQLIHLAQLRHEMRGRPYESSKLELLRSAYDGPFGANEEDLSSVFCSELIAEAYQRMGLLDNALPANEFTPGEMAAPHFAPGQLGPIQELTK